MPAKSLQKIEIKHSSYKAIRAIDGWHPFQDSVQGSFVSYQARKKENGKVSYFNFELAKEMGLIPKKHEHHLSPSLSAALLDTFSIQIINEYDLVNETKVESGHIKPKQYMATRYLQLQHPNKQGMTSGDGRSIWNGVVEGKDATWDISSCGTGATCLSPATAIHKRFFRTGDPMVSYGCGHSTLSEGIIDVLFSEILSKNRIETERILCVVEYPGGTGITVRAGKNLLRPSHFFNHLKQGQIERLKQVTDYYIERQVKNNIWNVKLKSKAKYDYLLDRMVDTFSQITANFETQYIFCWLDWDGDNILADGGIIDFGSVRQFGLFYYQYKFDDHERWSTSIMEQRQKARYIVQSYAQMVDYIKTGKKKPLERFKNHKALKRFDELVAWKRREYILRNVGYTDLQIKYLMRFKQKAVTKLETSLSYFERIKSQDGIEAVPDGVNCKVLANIRKLLAEYPEHLKIHDSLRPEDMRDLMSSHFAMEEEIPMTRSYIKHVETFEHAYSELLRGVAKNEGTTTNQILSFVIKRSRIINNLDRITGDSVCMVADSLIKKRKRSSFEDFDGLIGEFIDSQVLNPDYKPKKRSWDDDFRVKHSRFFKGLKKIISDYSEGL